VSGVLATLTDFVTNAIVQYGYLAIFVLMLLESACIPIPSESRCCSVGLWQARDSSLAARNSIVSGSSWWHRRQPRWSWLAYWAGAARKAFGRPMGRYLLIRPHEVDRCTRLVR